MRIVQARTRPALPIFPIAATVFAIAVLATIWACGGTSTSARPGSTSPPTVTLVEVASGFNHPVDLQQPADGSGRFFVVEQAGTIRIIQNGVVLAPPFLDITSKVDSSGTEMGLLGLAFTPGFAQNHRFFVHYDRSIGGQIQSVIAEYQVSASDANQADPASERILLTVNQPFTNHKGGQLAFGSDGFLYIGLGDGGSEGDPLGNGQNLQTLLGKMLRIDVNATGPGTQYSVPPDNPFVSGGGLPEIWAYGLRNPWRFSFDRANGNLFAADVGGDRIEEVNLITRGGNFGWNITEGTLCFNPASGCNETGLILPIAEYDHSEGNAIIGGYVYHGTSVPALQHAYIFGDLGTGKIWILTQGSAETFNRTLLLTTGRTLSSFGQDQAGEVYVVDYNGIVFQIGPG